MLQNKNSRPAVEVQGLCKTYPPQIVLDHVSLELTQGEIVAVLGRSGTGKSVLLKLIIGLRKPDAGSIRIQGEEITTLQPDQLNRVRRRIGFLFQQAALYDSMTVEENVAFPLQRHLRLGETQMKQRVRYLLSRVEMESSLQKMPAEISGGMQKRVGLARALALDPSILLLDEPTTGLDPITAAEINALIVELQKERGLSSIVVTHDVQSARTIADRIVLLHEGNFIIGGSFEELWQSQDSFVVEFLKHSIY